jgi:urocanate hydratase
LQLNRQSSPASDGGSEGASETFAAVGAKHFASTGSSLAGKFVVSGGMGGTGGAQSLAETMNGACFPGVDVYFCF